VYTPTAGKRARRWPGQKVSTRGAPCRVRAGGAHGPGAGPIYGRVERARRSREVVKGAESRGEGTTPTQNTHAENRHRRAWRAGPRAQALPEVARATIRAVHKQEITLSGTAVMFACLCSPVVKTSRCGREDPGSIPGRDIFTTF
jgi:hypothetical protein